MKIDNFNQKLFEENFLFKAELGQKIRENPIFIKFWNFFCVKSAWSITKLFGKLPRVSHALYIRSSYLMVVGLVQLIKLFVKCNYVILRIGQSLSSFVQFNQH